MSGHTESEHQPTDKGEQKSLLMRVWKNGQRGLHFGQSFSFMILGSVYASAMYIIIFTNINCLFQCFCVDCCFFWLLLLYFFYVQSVFFILLEFLMTGSCVIKIQTQCVIGLEPSTSILASGRECTKRIKARKKKTQRNATKSKLKRKNFHWRTSCTRHAHGMHYENKHKCQLTTLIIKQWLKL